MSRYRQTREDLSPYSSQLDSQGLPRITDEDYSYITSQDLEHDYALQPTASSGLEDDVLVIKHNNDSYLIQFPAYAISEGEVLVRDVKDRVALEAGVSESQKAVIKMWYKGLQLKDDQAAVRDYGLKNNSEILVVLPDCKVSDKASSGEDGDGAASVGNPRSKTKKKRKTKSVKSKQKTSARDSTNLDVPQGGGTTADTSSQPSRDTSPGVAGPLEKLQSISSHFNTKLLPICVDFTANPPEDRKRREDEHRKLSETVMAQVLLKLDEVDTGGDPDIRLKRKALVNQVQEVLKGLDAYVPSVSRP